jgi:hypothetical protein
MKLSVFTVKRLIQPEKITRYVLLKYVSIQRLIFFEINNLVTGILFVISR